MSAEKNEKMRERGKCYDDRLKNDGWRDNDRGGSRGTIGKDRSRKK